ncbi:MAG TPA: VWA domain-containing protein [Kofleriaceae bacterium]|nr:VWA domain-containing protein [Kofleriaceae bacterium]
MRSWSGLVVCGFLLAACGGDSGPGGGGSFGATAGGVKDMRYARDLISKGVIPPPDAILVEAMFSEHDLALDGPPCARTLCLRSAAGFADSRGFVQVGLSSTIDPETWERPPTTFIFTVDVSGSMGWGYGDGATPGELSRALLHTLTEQLREDDQVAIVTYGDVVSTKLAITSGAAKPAIHQIIGALQTEGVTAMEKGMQRAYEVAANAPASTPNVRVIVFTDTQPNVGATSPESFNAMVAAAADGGVYTTVLGLGVGMAPDVFRAMASLRGANAFSLTSQVHIGEWFLDEWPWFTTPIAFDLRVNASLSPGWAIERGFGFPAATDAQQVGLKASSVFLSKRRGALLVELDSPNGTPAGLDGTFSLAYVDANGSQVTETTPFAYDGSALARGQWFAQHGVARATALALLTDAMHQAAIDYAAHPDFAEVTMRLAYDRFTADAAQLGDADLAQEVDFARSLLTLIEERAEQGALYGDYAF